MTKRKSYVVGRYLDLEHTPPIPIADLPVLPVYLLHQRPAPPEGGCGRCHTRSLWTEPVITDSGVVPSLWHWRCLCGWEGADYRKVAGRTGPAQSRLWQDETESVWEAGHA